MARLCYLHKLIMEGAQGPNLAQVAAMQQFAEQGGDEDSINIVENTVVGFLFKKGQNPLGSITGNIEQVMQAFVNQSVLPPGFNTLMGQKELGFFGLKIFGRVARVNTHSEPTEIVGNFELSAMGGDSSSMMMDAHQMGEALYSAGVGFGGDADMSYIPPPMHTPPMAGHGAHQEMGFGA